MQSPVEKLAEQAHRCHIMLALLRYLEHETRPASWDNHGAEWKAEFLKSGVWTASELEEAIAGAKELRPVQDQISHDLPDQLMLLAKDANNPGFGGWFNSIVPVLLAGSLQPFRFDEGILNAIIQVKFILVTEFPAADQRKELTREPKDLTGFIPALEILAKYDRKKRVETDKKLQKILVEHPEIGRDRPVSVKTGKPWKQRLVIHLVQWETFYKKEYGDVEVMPLALANQNEVPVGSGLCIQCGTTVTLRDGKGTCPKCRSENIEPLQRRPMKIAGK